MVVLINTLLIRKHLVHSLLHLDHQIEVFTSDPCSCSLAPSAWSWRLDLAALGRVGLRELLVGQVVVKEDGIVDRRGSDPCGWCRRRQWRRLARIWPLGTPQALGPRRHRGWRRSLRCACCSVRHCYRFWLKDEGWKVGVDQPLQSGADPTRRLRLQVLPEDRCDALSIRTVLSGHLLAPLRSNANLNPNPAELQILFDGLPYKSLIDVHLPCDPLGVPALLAVFCNGLPLDLAWCGGWQASWLF